MKRCQEHGCGRKVYARRLCTKHYRRLRAHGSTLAPDERQHDEIAAALDWILDGDPLTTPFERALHHELVSPGLAGVAL